MQKEQILIMDLGSKHTQLIARKIRQKQVLSKILNPNSSAERLKKENPKGIVLISDEPSPNPQSLTTLNIPILKIENYADFNDNDLDNFLFEICKCSSDWKMEDFVQNTIQEIRQQVGEKKVLCALSGGVDSSVTAVMIHQAIGSQLHCIFVDHGLLRKNEGDEVEKVFKEQFKINFTRVNAQKRFLNALENVTDPEQKRKIIGETFIRVFEEEAKKLGNIHFLAQGTIYPDIIESGTAKSALVKSHHNVGGLPENIDFEGLVEPLKDLFKDEVRQAGIILGIPQKLVFRQPFPGPGIGVRVIGELTEEKLNILREADAIYREEIDNSGLKIWQYFAILTNTKTVGVWEGERSYAYTLALRAVNSTDGMQADWIRIPWELLDKISQRITQEVQGINRVVYDISPKPPATIEWE